VRAQAFYIEGQKEFGISASAGRAFPKNQWFKNILKNEKCLASRK